MKIKSTFAAFFILISPFILLSQNVGVGTLTPQAKLHIKSNSNVGVSNLLLEEDDNDYARLSFTNNGTTKFWATAAYTNAVDSLSWFNIYNSSTGNLLTVNGKGKLGIGTAPAYPLSFNNNLGDKIALWGGNWYGDHFGFGIQTALLQIHTAYVNDDVAFGYGHSNDFTETFRIKGNGMVGIGTSTPAFPLNFASSVGDKISLYGFNPTSHYGFGIQNNLMQIHSSTNISDIAFGYGGSTAFTEAMRVKGNGKVGIGTDDPDSRFHVAGGSSGIAANVSAVSTFENSGSTYVQLLSGNESGLLFSAGANSTDGAIIYNTSGMPNGLLFRTNNNVNRLTISSAGNVAIGNFVSSFPLGFSSTLGDKISLWGGTASSHFGFGIQTSLLQIHTANINDDIAFGFGGSNTFTETMRIKGNGNVGIATTTPDAELEVNGYTKLGTDAPKIKMLKLTGNTQSSQGSPISIPHGLNANNIISVEVLVWASPYFIPHSYTVSPGYEYHYAVGANTIEVFNKAGNSANILSKPLKILITYEEG